MKGLMNLKNTSRGEMDEAGHWKVGVGDCNLSLNGSVGAIIIASLQVPSACDPNETKGAPDVRFVKTPVCQAQTIFYNDDGSL